MEDQRDTMDPLYCSRCRRRTGHAYLVNSICPACALRERANAADTPAPIRATREDLIIKWVLGSLAFVILYLVGTCMGPTWDFQAARVARQAVRSELLAPRTAHFSDERMTLSDDGRSATVWGFVDAENGFGVSIRQKWVVDVRKDGSKWIAGDPHLSDP